MKVEFEFEVNRALEDAFRSHLEDVLAGSYEHNDKSYLMAQIEEVTQKPADEWSEGTLKDLSVYLMGRAGFQNASGYCGEEFEA